jgi:hypothetical protein
MEKIKNNLDLTVNLMHQNIQNITHRGLQLNELEVESEKLVESSNLFVRRLLPFHKRCWYWFLRLFPSWWCHCQESIQEPPQRFLTIV